MHRMNKGEGFFSTRGVRLAALLLVAMATLTGCADDPIVAPGSATEEPAPQEALTAEERALLTAYGVSAAKAGNAVSRAAVYTFDDPFGTPMGTSLIVRQNDGVLALLRSADLTPGEAVTMWWVLFNAPEHCTDHECGDDDLTNTAARPDILYADGKIIRDSNANGASWRDAYFFAARAEGTADGSINPALLEMPALGLEDARRAEVHLVLRTHGPVVPALAHDMVTTFAGGCTGFPASLGKGGPNTCADIQFAVHQPAP